MTGPPSAPGDELVLDGNAIAGLLAEIYGAEVTAERGTCRHCDTVSAVGTLRAWTRGPGIVLRCPVCEGVVLRIADTPRGRRIDAAWLAGLPPR